MVRVSDIMIGDSPLWQLIAGVSFVVLVFAYALISIARKAENADRLQYPTLGQVQAADEQKLKWWLDNLPKPCCTREADVIGLITCRYINLQQPESPVDAIEYQVKDEDEFITDYHGQ